MMSAASGAATMGCSVCSPAASAEVPISIASSGKGPESSINFVTCHDGFTLNDLVSYRHKHNEANGEENRDGATRISARITASRAGRTMPASSRYASARSRISC